MAEAKLTAKGRLVVPKPIRQYLNVQQGDRIDFVIMNNGEVVIRPATRDVRELKSILPRPKKTASLADMDRAIRKRGGSMP